MEIIAGNSRKFRGFVMKWNVGTKRLFANHNLTPIGTPIIGESPAPLLKERGSDILKVEANI